MYEIYDKLDDRVVRRFERHQWEQFRRLATWARLLAAGYSVRFV